MGYSAALLVVHRRLALSGFLGLCIVGFAYQFYPPRMAWFRSASDRSALVTISTLAGGLAVECLGLLVGRGGVETLGVLLSLAGMSGYAYLLTWVLAEE